MTVEVSISLNQGRYYRHDAKAYLSDYEYREWQRKHKIEFPMENGGALAIIRKANVQHICSYCPYFIHPGTHYYHIQFGKGLGAMKFPDRVHLQCWDNYWAERAQER